jgi:hypothetical protein
MPSRDSEKRMFMLRSYMFMLIYVPTYYYHTQRVSLRILALCLEAGAVSQDAFSSTLANPSEYRAPPLAREYARQLRTLKILDSSCSSNKLRALPPLRQGCRERDSHLAT